MTYRVACTRLKSNGGRICWSALGLVFLKFQSFTSAGSGGGGGGGGNVGGGRGISLGWSFANR